MTVPYFKRYTVKDWEVEKFKETSKVSGASHFFENERPMSHKRLVNECKPEEGGIDARILFELTGER